MIKRYLNIEGFLFFPNTKPLAAIGADVNVFAAFGDIFSEFLIIFIVPDVFERFIFQTSQPVCSVFIKTTRHYGSIPGDYIALP
jgi:hypothetical protein